MDHLSQLHQLNMRVRKILENKDLCEPVFSAETIAYIEELEDLRIKFLQLNRDFVFEETGLALVESVNLINQTVNNFSRLLLFYVLEHGADQDAALWTNKERLAFLGIS